MWLLNFLKSKIIRLKGETPKKKLYLLLGLLIVGYVTYKAFYTRSKIVRPVAQAFEVPINRFLKALTGDMINHVVINDSNMFFKTTKSQISYFTNIAMIPKTMLFKILL